MFSPSGFGQTIAVIDQSGKVVSSSRHLLNLFKEAKSVYQDRKAEIRRGPVRANTFADNRSAASSHRSHRSRSTRYSERERGPHESRHDGHRRDAPRRRHSDELRPGSPRAPPPASPTLVDDGGYYSPHSPRSPAAGGAPQASYFPAGDLALRPRPGPPGPRTAPLDRSYSTGHIDMDLAYGDLPHESSLTLTPGTARAGGGGGGGDEAQLQGLVGRARGLLVEADCLKHSATHCIASLQRNPDALAAVGLTLAEISKLVRRMAPGALLDVRRLCPAVFSLLVSPQFLIAAGVGVGLTVIALGGFKIVKKIQADRAAAAREQDEQELVMALPAELSRVETWRRGIADVEAESIGTSVEGELITPAAAQLSRLHLHDDRGADRPRSREAPGSPARPSPSRAHTVSSAHSTSSRGSRRTSTGGRERRPEGKAHRPDSGKARSKSMVKRPSPLRALFSP